MGNSELSETYYINGGEHRDIEKKLNLLDIDFSIRINEEFETKFCEYDIIITYKNLEEKILASLALAKFNECIVDNSSGTAKY